MASADDGTRRVVRSKKESRARSCAPSGRRLVGQTSVCPTEKVASWEARKSVPYFPSDLFG
jgi:hypothetical protein